MADPGIVRNRAKINATIGNARAWLAAGRSRSSYLWSFVDGEPVQERVTAHGRAAGPHRRVGSHEQGAEAARASASSAATICYSLMQACGMVNDHVVDCFRHARGAPRYGDGVAGAIAIVIFLLLLPVLILMAAAVGAAIFGNLLTARRRGPLRGQRAARSEPLSR